MILPKPEGREYICCEKWECAEEMPARARVCEGNMEK